MLKIRDNVDLKELKKFGFEYIGGNINTYYKVYFQKFLWFEIINNKTRGISIDAETRTIKISKLWGYDWIKADDCYAIKDLIQANLVEKVED